MAILDTPQPDLSLEELRFLVTVAKTKSLTTAASQYGISMGAASRRLSHLREVFDDELFIRSGVTMLPTMRMRRLLPRVLDLLAAGGALLSRDNVGLADSRRIVRLLAADSAVMTVFPLLVRQMAKDAPNASIELNPLSGDFLEQLRAGRADIAVYPLDTVPKDFHRLELYQSRRGILVRQGHPLIKKYEKAGRIELDDLRAFKHVMMNLPGTPELSPAAYQQYAFEVGISLPYFLGVPYVLADTDYVYIGPVVTLMHCLRLPDCNLRVLPAPPEVSPFTPAIIWHHGAHRIHSCSGFAACCFKAPEKKPNATTLSKYKKILARACLK